MFIKILYLFVAVILLKILYNVRNLIWTQIYLSNYEEFLTKQKGWYIQEHRQKIIKLFKMAGLENFLIPSAEPMGFGFVNTGGFTLFENLSVLRTDVAAMVIKCFKEARGVYRSRIFESLSPIYWIESVVNLPKNILKYLGLKSESIIIKFFQIIWWAMIFVSTVISIFFNENFVSWCKNLNIF